MLVAAWHEADHIGAHIAAFQALRYPNKELILCAGGADGTCAIAQGCANESIHILEQMPGEGKQRALRRCYAAASGELIYLTDADCLLIGPGDFPREIDEASGSRARACRRSTRASATSPTSSAAATGT
ncbi:MAG: glycosyltransferase [Deltaproteobacteria bacterium]|nr:glycosyltransferase [Deltaproteobacteria bacterium]